MSRDAETAPVPDKAALASVLNYLKTKNLKVCIFVVLIKTRLTYVAL